MTRQEAHLLVAAVRVQAHLKERSPTPAEVADLLDYSETQVRLQLNFLQDLGSVALVESAFESHVEVLAMEPLENLGDDSGPALSEDLKDFDRRQQEEAERMAGLFESGEYERNQQDKLGRMADELKDFQKKKPVNPFGED